MNLIKKNENINNFFSNSGVIKKIKDVFFQTNLWGRALGLMILVLMVVKQFVVYYVY
jgi:hypothetical protein